MINEIDFANQLAFNTIKNSPNVRATYNTLIPRFLRTNDNQNARKGIDLFKQNIGDDDYIKFYNGLYNYYNENYEKALEFFILSLVFTGKEKCKSGWERESILLVAALAASEPLPRADRRMLFINASAIEIFPTPSCPTSI